MTVALLAALILAWLGVEPPGPDGTVEAIAQAITDSADRESLDPLMVAAVIAQESSFDADPCSRRVALDRVLSRSPVEGHEDRELLRWTCGGSSGARECERVVWEVEERDGYLYLDTCPAGEVGLMQVLQSSRWAEAGYPIPGLDEVLSRRPSERRAQLLRPEVNIALGCRELAEHRAAALEDDPPGPGVEPQWWSWVGSYNTGTHHGEGARRYARTIVGRYLELCDLVIPTDAGDAPLRDVYPGCAEAEGAADELADR